MKNRLFDCLNCKAKKTVKTKFIIKDSGFTISTEKCKKCGTFHELKSNGELIIYNNNKNQNNYDKI
jgi:transcription elongation factor Elf1